MKKLFTDEEIQELQNANNRLTAKNESLIDELQLRTYEVEALRNERLKNLERIKTAEELLRVVINGLEVDFEIVECSKN